MLWSRNRLHEDDFSCLRELPPFMICQLWHGLCSTAFADEKVLLLAAFLDSVNCFAFHFV